MSGDDVESAAQEIEVVDNIEDLLRYDGPSFIECCYLSILGRQPVASELEPHVAKLDAGVRKIDVANTFAWSEEARARRRHLEPLSVSLIEYQIAELLNAAEMDADYAEMLKVAQMQLRTLWTND
jgi:hypothetical protein